MLVLMNRILFPCLFTMLALPATLPATTLTPLREGWKLQSACKLEATGDAIAQEGFAVDGWIKTTVPSTVVAAQAAAGVIPDPYYGSNLRQLPGTDYPTGDNFS